MGNESQRRADLESGIEKAREAERDLHKHPLSRPVTDAFGMYGFDQMGLGEDGKRAYEDLRGGKSTREIRQEFEDSLGEESKSSRKSVVSSGGYRGRRSSDREWDKTYEPTWKEMGVGEKVMTVASTTIALGFGAVVYGIILVPLSLGVWYGVSSHINNKKLQPKTSISRTYDRTQDYISRSNISRSVKARSNYNLEEIAIENSKKMLGLDDYAVCPEDLKIVFSKQTSTRYWTGPWSQSSGIRDRLFYCDMDGSNKGILDFSKLNREINHRISAEDFVAPMVSEDDERMVFAVTRHDHTSTLYTIGSSKVSRTGRVSMKKLTPYYSSIAFGWVSNDSLFFWGSPYNKSDFSRNLELFKGESFLINMYSGKFEKIENSLSKIISLNGSERMKIKFVSHSDVTSYVVRKLE